MPGPNLLADGGFESGLTGWTCPNTPTYNTFTRVTTDPHSGTYNLRNAIVNDSYSAGFYYSFTGLTAGEVYRISGYFRTEGGFQLGVYATDGSGGSGTPSGNSGSAAAWSPFQYDFQAPASSGRIYFVNPAFEIGLADDDVLELDDLVLELMGLSGRIDVDIDLDNPVLIEPISGSMDIDVEISGVARMPLRIPSRPAPAPPEELGVFPMPAFGGLTIRAVVGKTVTMDAPVIVDGKPT